VLAILSLWLWIGVKVLSPTDGGWFPCIGVVVSTAIAVYARRLVHEAKGHRAPDFQMTEWVLLTVLAALTIAVVYGFAASGTTDPSACVTQAIQDWEGSSTARWLFDTDADYAETVCG